MLIVEGAMGLLDAASGAAPGGPGSTQAVADALDLQVVLVIDAARMGQSVAAIVDGFNRAGPRPLAGVILNQVGSARHAQMLRDAVTPLAPVLGVLPRRPDLDTPSRHLGLVQAAERADLETFLDRAADWVAEGCDLDAVQSHAATVRVGDTLATGLAPLGQRIAVAQDAAFGFTYTHVLQDWQKAGAEILPFSPLADESPVLDADAVFLPGGYPELHAGRLAAATRFHAGLQAAARRGSMTYGECGGYMVLGQGLVDADGTRHAMAGLLALETSFAERARHLGYRKLRAPDGPLVGHYRGHEFHYATTLRADGPALFEAKDAENTLLAPMGLMQGKVMGSFGQLIGPEPGTSPKPSSSDNP